MLMKSNWASSIIFLLGSNDQWKGILSSSQGVLNTISPLDVNVIMYMSPLYGWNIAVTNGVKRYPINQY